MPLEAGQPTRRRAAYLRVVSVSGAGSTRAGAIALDLAEDRKLLEAFRRGEATAIERVYRDHVDRVSALLRRGFSFQSDGGTMTFRGYDNAWDLECAVQDTFAQAFSPNARAAYDGISPYAPYLLRIARNRVISEMRSRQRERRRREAFAEAPHEPPSTPEREAMQAELAQLVERFRSQLDETDRRFLALRWSDELPLLEVARRLGLTRMRARTREKKVRARFLAYLRDSGFSSADGEGGGGGQGGVTLLVLGLGLVALARLERLS